jgi:hypothetical protein
VQAGLISVYFVGPKIINPFPFNLTPEPLLSQGASHVFRHTGAPKANDAFPSMAATGDAFINCQARRNQCKNWSMIQIPGKGAIIPPTP